LLLSVALVGKKLQGDSTVDSEHIHQRSAGDVIELELLRASGIFIALISFFLQSLKNRV
jgi:hypothetical protein